MKNFLLAILALQINLICFSCSGCSVNNKKVEQAKSTETKPSKDILTGAQQTEKYLPILKGKRIGLVVNQTAQINGVLLVDTLKKLDVNIKAIFGPEHGFRGTADAGEKVGNYIDSQTGIPVISLYGAKQQPSKEDLKDFDLVIFDIQDVGVRFYTYTITMARVMQACADSKVPMLILDRPNPNGHLIDGPILDLKFKSGVGMHQIPIAHGLTSAEFALMVNGEGWLKDAAKCDVKVIKNANYKHQNAYELPVKPSPNLPNALSIYLYPSLCLFEGTVVSQGRGTLFPFQVIGHPALKKDYSFTFTPKSIDGMSKNPPLENQLCYGIDFRNSDIKSLQKQPQLDVNLWLNVYKAFPDQANYFNAFFNKLAGNDILMQQIKDGMSEKEIRASWEAGLTDYKAKRKKYLLYD